jgi:hypothetical protein
MQLVRLVCWNRELAEEHGRLLARPGWKVDASPLNPSGLIGQFRDHPPAVVVLDLDRLPSHGREIGVMLRNGKSTRRIPLVFAGGAPEKVARIRGELPDAVFTSWEQIAGALDRAVRDAPAEPVRATPHMARYTGASLPRKLGVKPGTTLALLGAPEGFENLVEAKVEARLTRRTEMVLWFVHSRRELESEMAYLAARLPAGCALWVMHPKQSGRYRVDFNQNDVRAAGLSVGLVDYKVCAVDADWSGLKFARRRSPEQLQPELDLPGVGRSRRDHAGGGSGSRRSR